MQFFTKLVVLCLLGLLLVSGASVPPSPGETEAHHIGKHDNDLHPRIFSIIATVGFISSMTGITGFVATERRNARNKRRIAADHEAQMARDKKEKERHDFVVGEMKNLTLDVMEVKHIVQYTEMKVEHVEKTLGYFYGVDDEFPDVQLLSREINHTMPCGADLETWRQCVFDVLRARWFSGVPISTDVDLMSPDRYSVLLKMPRACHNVVYKAATAHPQDAAEGIQVRDCITDQVLYTWRHKDCIILQGLNTTDKNKLQENIATLYSTLTDDIASDGTEDGTIFPQDGVPWPLLGIIDGKMKGDK